MFGGQLANELRIWFCCELVRYLLKNGIRMMKELTRAVVTIFIFTAISFAAAHAQQTRAQCEQDLLDFCRADPDVNSSAAEIERCYRDNVGHQCHGAAFNTPTQPKRPAWMNDTPKQPQPPAWMKDVKESSMMKRCKGYFAGQGPTRQWLSFIGCSFGERICNGENANCQSLCRGQPDFNTCNIACSTGRNQC